MAKDLTFETEVDGRAVLSAATRRYLGDGCYAELVPDGIVLTTENGIEVTNRIFLEPEVFGALVDYVAALKGSTP